MPPTISNPPTTAQQYVQQAIAEQSQIIAQGQYQMLGQVMRIRTDRGVMEFYGSGPLIGRRHDRMDLVMVTEWPGLPDKRTATAAPCVHCAVKCEQCEGKKASTCELCGGAGERLQQTVCDCLKTGGPFEACECHGIGMIGKPHKCAACNGTKTIACPRCRGTGQEATGLYPPKPGSPVCPKCQGQRVVVKLAPQQLVAFLQGKLGDMPVYGPIRSIVLVAMDGSRNIDIVEVEPDRQGNLMVLGLDKQANVTRGYFLGGVARIATARA